MPDEVWTYIVHQYLDGKRARRLAALCSNLAEAAHTHEDNVTPPP